MRIKKSPCVGKHSLEILLLSKVTELTADNKQAHTHTHAGIQVFAILLKAIWAQRERGREISLPILKF